MIRTCPGFEKYGINDKGEIVSSCRGNWVVLNPSKGVLCLHGKKTTSCKIAKFRYCVEHQISPLKISCVGALITIDGRIMTKGDFIASRNEYIAKSKADIPRSDKIKKIQRHIDFAQAAIDWLNGEPEKILDIITAEREKICSLLHCNNSLARCIVAEAELQLFRALDNGTVIDPMNWLIKRSRGILSEQKRNFVRFSDENLMGKLCLTGGTKAQQRNKPNL